MRRAGAVATEVRGGIDEPGAEVMLPDPIDDHPRGQWIVWTGDGTSQGDSSRRFGGAGIQVECPDQPGNVRCDLFQSLHRVATFQAVSGLGGLEAAQESLWSCGESIEFGPGRGEATRDVSEPEDIGGRDTLYPDRLGSTPILRVKGPIAGVSDRPPGVRSIGDLEVVVNRCRGAHRFQDDAMDGLRIGKGDCHRGGTWLPGLPEEVELAGTVDQVFCQA